MHTDLQVGGT